jgi:hypothetical protein
MEDTVNANNYQGVLPWRRFWRQTDTPIDFLFERHAFLPDPEEPFTGLLNPSIKTLA